VRPFAEATIRSQMAFATALQEGVSMWQKSVAAALKETTGEMPISSMLQDYLQDTLRLLTPPAAEACGWK